MVIKATRYLLLLSLSSPKLTSSLTFCIFFLSFMTPSLKADSSCCRVRWRSECSADGVKEEFQAMGGAIRLSSCVAVRDSEDGGRL